LWIVKPASNPEESSYKSQLTTTQVYAETGNAITAPQHGRFVIFIDSDGVVAWMVCGLKSEVHV
jgi:hypothetical protein